MVLRSLLELQTSRVVRRLCAKGKLLDVERDILGAKARGCCDIHVYGDSFSDIDAIVELDLSHFFRD